MGGKRRTRKKKPKKQNSALVERKKASQKIGTVRGAEGSPGVGSFNKKFLTPNSLSAGKFTGNVYRPTEEFRQGQGRKKKKKHQPQARTQLQSAVSKCKIKKTNKQKSCFPIVAPPPTFSRKRKDGKKKTPKNHTQKHHTQNLGSDCSSQFQSAKVSRLIAILGLRKLLKRDLIASTVQEKWGVRVSVSSRAQLALARARSLRLPPPSLAARAGSCRSVWLPLSSPLPFSIYCLLFCSFQLGRARTVEHSWIGRPSLHRRITSFAGQLRRGPKGRPLFFFFLIPH